MSIPSILMGLQGTDAGNLSNILSSAKNMFGSFDFDNILGGIVGTNDGAAGNVHYENNSILNNIFGDKISSIVSAIASFLGAKNSSVTSLLGASLPAVISGITNRGTNWDLSSITNLLNENKSAFASAIPTSLGLGAFGSLFAKNDPGTPEVEIPRHEPVVPPVTPVTPREEPRVVHTNPPVVEEEKKGAGLWWILIPILLLLLWFLFGKGCQGDKTVTSTNDTLNNTVVTQDTTVIVNTNTREYIDVQLPDGKTVKAYPSGIEQQLIAFLQSEDYKNLSDDQLKDKWFDFDNLNFETGTATVTPESQTQLENIAAIMTLFPEAKIKIGGYTDKTGDEAINKKISQDRADAVKNYLSSKGLGNQVVGAEGYGSEFATVPADATDAEREKDRRVAVSVRK